MRRELEKNKRKDHTKRREPATEFYILRRIMWHRKRRQIAQIPFMYKINRNT